MQSDYQEAMARQKEAFEAADAMWAAVPLAWLSTSSGIAFFVIAIMQPYWGLGCLMVLLGVGICALGNRPWLEAGRNCRRIAKEAEQHRKRMNRSNEQAVRESLQNRPAGALQQWGRGGGHRSVSATFASLFNGAQKGSIFPNGVFKCGKAEAEWGWPENWDRLVEAGLITYDIVDGPGDWKTVNWSITDKGWDIREDDLAYFKELMDAKDADDEDAADALSQEQVADLQRRFERGQAD